MSSHSPVPEKAPEPSVMIQEYTFYEALQEIANDKMFTKMEWGDPNIVIKLVRDEKANNSILCINFSDGKLSDKFHPLKVSDGDMAGEDYVEVV